MVSFFSAAFAIAGSAAALGPLLIHLWNRRRFRIVRWAAMDFLREAAARSRRSLRLRDLLLLLLRTLALALFGLAMARPYVSRSDSVALRDEPVHAVLIIDNSLSMSYQQLGGTLLDEARAKARDLIDRLPAGSWISVLPLCGSTAGVSRDAYRTKEDAIEALAAIETVDRQGSVGQALALAADAVDHVRELTTRRVVLISDQQAVNWPRGIEAEVEAMPDLQIVEVAASEPENSWVASFAVRDEIAEADAPAALTATIRHDGKGARLGVPVTLTVGGTQVATQIVDLQPGQNREVTFFHVFEPPMEPTRPAFVPAVVSLPPDRLPGDDQRSLIVPVASGLPVVFVDSLGADEDPAKGKYGETFRLRKLLAPVTGKNADAKELARATHLGFSGLSRAAIESARLIVVAGVERPGPAVQLLREFVEQGGSLVVTAGADFDPAAWTQEAWLGGLGILPAPLEPEVVGRLPSSSGEELKPFAIAVDTISSDYFLPPGVGRQELDDLYAAPLFFKAVSASVGPRTLEELTRGLPQGPKEEVLKPDPPRVLAKLTNGLPLLIERKIGKGAIVFFASGVQSEWCTLTRTHAVILFDRIFRSLLARTLSRRDFDPRDSIVIPVEPADRRASFTLFRPMQVNPSAGPALATAPEPLMAEALGADDFGLTIRHAIQRGLYTLREDRTAAPPGSRISSLDSLTLSVNGPERESELRSITEPALRERLHTANWHWVPRSERIPVEGALARGQSSWRWLMTATLLVLLLELAIGAWTHAGSGSLAGASRPARKGVAA